jgi:hypothetical protein
VFHDHPKNIAFSGATQNALLYDPVTNVMTGIAPSVSVIRPYIESPAFSFGAAEGAGGLELSDLTMSVSNLRVSDE